MEETMKNSMSAKTGAAERIDFDARAPFKIMGIVNVTPNSFSDGGKFLDPAAAIAHARQLIEEGADIIDVGGESTGPGSVDVSVEEELRRVIPVIEGIAAGLKTETTVRQAGARYLAWGGDKSARAGVIISVDTNKAEVARQAIAAGARMVNDVTALRGDSEMARAVAEAGVPVVLMYSKDATARTTRDPLHYDDVVKTVYDFLKARIDFALAAGIRRENIIIDPGMGAFVSGEPRYSYELLERLREFAPLGLPILVGVSRKSFLPGALNNRLEPGLAANELALKNGASFLRVHDVLKTKSLFS